MLDRLGRAGFKLRHPRALILLTAAAAVALLAGVAVAAIPDSDDGEIHGCYQKNQGQLRVIDAEAGASCGPAEKALVWNQVGPPGATGPRGPSNGFSRFHDGELPAT